MNNDFKKYDEKKCGTYIFRLANDVMTNNRMSFHIFVETRLKNLLKSKVQRKSWYGNAHFYLSCFFTHLGCNKQKHDFTKFWFFKIQMSKSWFYKILFWLEWVFTLIILMPSSSIRPAKSIIQYVSYFL